MILQHHRTHTLIRRMRSVLCDPLVVLTPRSYNIIGETSHHHRIVQRRRAHTLIRRMRPFCNHHLQDFTTSSHHHRIAHTHTHTRDACDPFVVLNPRFYQRHRIITGSSPDRTATTRTHPCVVCASPYAVWRTKKRAISHPRPNERVGIREYSNAGQVFMNEEMI